MNETKHTPGPWKLPTKIGEKLAVHGRDNATGYVKKSAAETFVLFDYCNPYRTRWGNATEIRQDIAFFVENGELPPASGEAW